MKRSEILNTAKEYVCKDREEQYGNPEDNFSLIAKFWDIYIDAKHEAAGKRDKLTTYNDGNCEIKTYTLVAEDVANMMGLLKLARIITGIPNPDNYIDFVGYVSCAGEIGTKEIIREIKSCFSCVGCEMEPEDGEAVIDCDSWIKSK